MLVYKYRGTEYILIEFQITSKRCTCSVTEINEANNNLVLWALTSPNPSRIQNNESK